MCFFSSRFFFFLSRNVNNPNQSCVIFEKKLDGSKKIIRPKKLQRIKRNVANCEFPLENIYTVFHSREESIYLLFARII